MQEQYITHLDTQARLELEKEKARLFYKAVIVGEILLALTTVVYFISGFYK